MKKYFVASSMVIGSLMIGSIALASPYGFGYRNHHGNFMGGAGMMTTEQYQQMVDQRLNRMDVILDLSDRQKEQIKTLLSTHWQARQTDRDAMREGRDARQAAMRSGEIDEATIRSNMAQRATYQADRAVEQVKMKKAVYAILTPAQQDKANQLFTANGCYGNNGYGRGNSGYGHRNGMRGFGF